MIRVIEWLNANQYRRYPFVDDSSLVVDGEPGHILDNDFLLDFQVTVNQWVSLQDIDNTKLVSITVLPSLTSVDLVFSVGSWIWTVEVPVNATWPYTVQGAATDVANYTVTVGPGVAQFVEDEAVGTHSVNALLLPSLIMVQTGVRVDTISNRVLVIAGAIDLEPGYNCEPTATGHILRFNAGSGLGAGLDCTKSENDVLSCADAFLWFNGVHASTDGNIELKGGDGVSVKGDPATNTITIKGATVLSSVDCG